MTDEIYNCLKMMVSNLTASRTVAVWYTCHPITPWYLTTLTTSRSVTAQYTSHPTTPSYLFILTTSRTVAVWYGYRHITGVNAQGQWVSRDRLYFVSRTSYTSHLLVAEDNSTPTGSFSCSSKVPAWTTYYNRRFSILNYFVVLFNKLEMRNFWSATNGMLCTHVLFHIYSFVWLMWLMWLMMNVILLSSLHLDKHRHHKSPRA